MTLNVHILSTPEHLALEHLHNQLLTDVQVTVGNDLPTPADFHILVAGRPSQEQLEASPNLQAVIIPFAGVPTETRELLAGHPHLSLHNLHHNEAPTAELAMALLLAAARHVVPIDQRFRRHDWTLRYDPPSMVVLDGLNLLLLGYGAIGQRIARACQALGMHIRAVRRNPKATGPADIAADIHPLADLHRLLPTTDVLMITLPLTEETEGLIGAQELALLPPGALLINIGRAPVVDEEAFYQALKGGHLAAAASDVWYRYPDLPESRTNTPPSRFPFHQLDNMVMSPHRGGAFGAPYTERARMTHLAQLFNAAAQGRPMANRVDLAAGY